jgi:dCMP deaminase
LKIYITEICIVGRLNWEEYFVSLSVVVSLRSPDVFTKVGAVCVSKENRILSCGYNGLLAGVDAPEGFYKERENPDRFLYTVHAEANALTLCRPNEVHTIAITCSPCAVCAKMIASYGIKRVLYLQEYHREKSFKDIFQFYNIEYSQVNIPDIFCPKILENPSAPLI